MVKCRKGRQTGIYSPTLLRTQEDRLCLNSPQAQPGNKESGLILAVAILPGVYLGCRMRLICRYSELQANIPGSSRDPSVYSGSLLIVRAFARHQTLHGGLNLARGLCLRMLQIPEPVGDI